MADQSKNLILKLKLDVDTSGTVKLDDSLKRVADVVKDIAKKTSELNEAEQAKLTLLDNQRKAFIALEAVQARQIAFAEKNISNSGLALSNLSKAILKHNQINSGVTDEIAQTEKLIKAQKDSLAVLEAQRKVLVSKADVTSSLATKGQAGQTQPASKLTGSFNYGTGATTLRADPNILKAEQANYAKQRIADETSLAEKVRNIELDNIKANVLDNNTKLNAQVDYARQRLMDEKDSAEKIRKVQLESLKSSIQESEAAKQQVVSNRGKAEQEAYREEESRNKVKLARNKEILATNLADFNAQLSEQQARMKASVAIQTAEQVHGINSVQANRARAFEEQRILEKSHRAELEAIQSKVSTGTITPSAGITASTSATTKHTEAVLSNNKALREQEARLAANVVHHRNLFARVGEVIGAYQIWNTVLTYTKQALLAIPNAGIELESTKAALFGIFGSEKGAKNMQFLSELADHAGQSLLGLEQAYRRYAPSAILAGASQEAINKSFKDFAELGTILHLPEDKLNSLFLALDQMFAKGVVQSEEIKKQLGNVLPGAVEVGAKAMEMTPSAFMNAMSKNLVIAKDFIPKFAKVYRETFGGVDDSVFESIRVKLLSNLQRVENEYLRINREIYNSTQEMMNSIVKSVAGALTTVRENLTGIGQAIEIFAELMVARLGIALVSSLGSIGLLVTKLGSLIPILTGLSLPVTAVVLGFLELYRSLNDLSIKYDEATGFSVRFEDGQVSLTNYIRAFAIIAIEDLTLAYQKFMSLFSDSNLMQGIGAAFDFIASKSQSLFPIMAATAALAKKASGSIESLPDLYKAGLKDLVGSLEKAPVIKLAAELDFKGRPKPEAVIPPMGAGKTIEDGTGDVSSKAAAAARKALTNLYKDIERDLKLIAEQTKTSLADLDESYAKNLVSISTYYSSKAKLQYSEIDRQKAVYEREIAVARKAGDIAKIEEIKDKIVVLSEQAKQIPSILGKAQFKDLETYNKGLKETNADYQELIGNIRNAAKIRFDITETPKIAAYKAVVGDTTSSAATKQAAETALQQEKSIRANAGILTEINALNTERNELEAIYNQKIQVVNVQMRAGVLSQISGMFELKILRDKEIKDLEEKVRLEEEVVRNARLVDPKFELSAKVQKEVELAKSSLESLKAEGDIVGNYFKTIVGDSFQTAFEGLISGSMSASQAFSSFAQSVLSDMQKIIASEIRSQIIGAVFKGLGTVFGAALGGMGSGSAGRYGVPNTNFGGLSPSADGNVFSGAGISAHSGTIVSSPTVFPFAKGTGLMGEAGPEAILPLQRNSQGKLGVVVSNQNQTSAKSSGIVIQNFSVVVQEKEGTTSEEQAKLIGESVKKQLKVFVQQELINSTRSGGTLNPTSMAASF